MIPGAGFISGGKGSIRSLGFGLLPVIILEVYKIILTQKLWNSHVSQVKRSAFLLFGQPVLNITLLHALTGNISLHTSSGNHCLSIIVDIP